MTVPKVSERTVAGYRVSCGRMVPFGASHVRSGVNFSVFSANGTGCTLVLFKHGQAKPAAEIPFPADFRLGHVWAMIVHDLEPGDLEYGFRMEGPWNPLEGHYFDSSKILLDPYAREIVGREEWMQAVPSSTKPIFRSRLPASAGQIEPNQAPRVPDSELIIYELHLRGFTRHPNASVKNPGTFAGLAEKAAHLKELGVNCVELMPVFEFDEMENSRTNPTTGEILCNYWG
jgi:glycogen operon protein